ncbi:hypothetical protein [Aromatoleum evansii]|uniref:hypothetical protein n=1 Tax=Aromatoleum evansii TaxID=59406 RepID=UPI00145D5176|nr:hypothetical protein [Aromatoleum evansii]NMG31752.1 hypothetical protein [Aromatoleum evansii]
MKLLDSLQDVVNAVGPVRRAWFTTFTYNLDLIESYIAPVLAGADFPKTPDDYHRLQQDLFPIDGEAPIDIRVFHDIRASARDKVKRTSIPLYGVDFRSPHLNTPERRRFGDGFFHPKVIYLEGKNGAFVGAGSANLTLDGWGRNRECFHFEKLEGQSNRRAVFSFFRRIFTWCGLATNGQFPQVRGDEREVHRWRFVSSLSEESFLDHLAKGAPDKLTIWTPYLSTSLAEFADGIQDRHACFSDFAVVPDLMDGSKIRVPQPAVDAFLAASKSERRRSLYFDPTGAKSESSDARSRFSHAKVWLTPQHIAVGSWNLTRSALGVHPTRNNLEAGIVLFKQGGKPPTALRRITGDNAKGWSDEEAQESKDELDGLKRPPVSVLVTFDWLGDRRWSWKLISTIEPEVLAQLRPELLLPTPRGDLAVSLAKMPEGEKIVGDCGFMLKQRCVSLRYQEKGERVSTLVWVNECHPEERPATRFGYWEDLISSLIEGLPERDPRGRNPIAYDEDSTTEPNGSEGKSKPSISELSVSYFRMFAAMKGAALQLRDAGNPTELRRRIASYPGSVCEIVESTVQAIEANPQWSPIYRWFLIQELKVLVGYAKKIWKKAGRENQKTDLGNIDFAVLAAKIPPLPAFPQAEAKIVQILEFARAETGYP